mmetsp:Transcript_29882/g.92377  ORF Transcript_29882/g.92377 Transcript_29882/m.92377 type:complete len:471 (+) Transcript_29882:7768-9180(+)
MGARLKSDPQHCNRLATHHNQRKHVAAGRSRARGDRKAHQSARAFAKRLRSEAEPYSAQHTPIHACLVKIAEARDLAHETVESQQTRAVASLLVRRELLASLIHQSKKWDMEGTPTGATCDRVRNATFLGNATFFEWLLGRLRQRDSKLEFDPEHGRTAISLARELCVVRLIQSLTQPSRPKRIHLRAARTPPRNTAQQNLGKVCSQLVFDVHSITSLARGTLVLTQNVLSAIKPLRGQRLEWALTESYARLASWCLHRVLLLIDLKDGLFELKSRRSFVAVATAFPSKYGCPPDYTTSTCTHETLQTTTNDGPDGANSRWFAHRAQIGARLLRLEDARKGLTLQRHVETQIMTSVASREWISMAREDIGKPFQRRSCPVDLHENVKKPVVDFYDLHLLLRRLLVVEDWKDAMHHDGLAADQELEATRSAICRDDIALPLCLDRVLHYWIVSFELRKKRRALRIESRRRV